LSYRLSAEAAHDLLAILVDGIDRFGVARAYGYRTGLEHSFDLLGAHPGIDRLRTDLMPPLRVLPHRSHGILYDVAEDQTVTILRVRHGREDWISDPL